MKKKALIIGLSSQDGYFLSKLLVKKNFEVFGTIRNKCIWKQLDNKHFKKIKKIKYSNLLKFLNKKNFDEIYNFSNVNTILQSNTNLRVTYNSIFKINFEILEILRKQNSSTKFFHASSSEALLLKNNRHLRSAYSYFKRMTSELVSFYRKKYKIYAINGYLFNHESFLRKKNYLSSKIFFGVLNYVKKKKKFELDDVYSFKDRGLVEEFVKVFHKAISFKVPLDWEIGTGKFIKAESLFLECCSVFNLKIKKKKFRNNIYYYDRSNGYLILKSKIKKIQKNTKEIKCNTNSIKKFLKIVPSQNFKKLYQDYKKNFYETN
tara:strand:+ start:1977 stop:2936 length:960 start_codon:yes stop_codon:yes gene_type:complete